jgi:hypothetical protein
MIVAHPEKYQITAASGTIAQTINSGGGNICYEIFVEATTSSTTFDVTLTDKFGLVVYERFDITGKLSEMLQKIAYGNWTLTISSASVDEAFDVLLVFRET